MTEIRSPKVESTLRLSPRRQVSLPFSRSLINLIPVPLTKANSGCFSLS